MSDDVAFEAIIVDDLLSYSTKISRQNEIRVATAVGAVVHQAVQSVNANFDLDQTSIGFAAGYRVQTYPPG